MKVKKIKILGYICARLGSSRLPGKMLMNIAGKPAIKCVYDRFSKSKYLDKVIVATTNKTQDDPLCEYLQDQDIEFVRGDEDDVLGRIIEVINIYKPEFCVEVYGDAPFNDPLIVDEFICKFFNSSYDFIGNDMETTYPPGLDVEVFRSDALKHAAEIENDTAIREHGTLAIRMRPNTFKIKNIIAPPHLHRPNYQLSLDTKEDLNVFNIIAANLSHDVNAHDLVRFLDNHSELLTENKLIQRKFSEFRDQGLSTLQEKD